MVVLMSSCGELTELEDKGSKVDLQSSYYYTGEGLVYTVNPVVAKNSYNIRSADYGSKLVRDFVTLEPYLQRKNYFERAYSSGSTRETSGISNLFLVENDQEVVTIPMQSNNGSWRHTTHSDEFYQVNVFYHLNKLAERFYKTLAFGHAYLFLDSNMRIPPAIKYNYTETNSLWLTEDTSVKSLDVFSKCFLDPINAFFSAAENMLCFGYNNEIDNFNMAQDPSIIYHEMGHAFVQSMMNQRNIKFNNPFWNVHDFQSTLGVLFYDEAGAINEGIADYFSYFINSRDAVGEWGAGRYYASARPMSESHELHQISGISETSGERLSYPNFVQYNSNYPTTKDEDIHLSGQIVSHYFVALTKELKNQCSTPSLFSSVTSKYFSELTEMIQHDFELIYGRDSSMATESYARSHALASGLVMMMINETIAELGDLFGEGSDVIDDGYYFTNLNQDESYLWTHQVNPINFRRFFKIFAKNVKHHVSEGLCPQFTLDESEKLLDDYGLLLFTYYGDLGKTGNGNQTYSSPFVEVTLSDMMQGQSLNPVTAFDFNLQVNELNRRNTTLVSKEFLEIPSDTVAYVIDGQNSMKKILSHLTFQGKAVTTSTDVADVRYNNNNAKISPGEVIGIALNVRNTSNSTIAGLQILANDWDHMKIDDESAPYVDRADNIQHRPSQISNFKPCIYEGFPLETENGVKDTDDTDPGNCSYISRDNSIFDPYDLAGSTKLTKYSLDAPQPICLVQISDENETKWVSQNYYRKVVMGLEDSKCLNNNSLSDLEYNPNECLIRFLPGANQAYYSLLEPQKTWGETNFGSNSGSPTLNSNQAMVMEVNKWIEPGTKFMCRFRARFTNCIDCFAPDTSSDDYPEYMYSGAEPFKILNFSFTVID